MGVTNGRWGTLVAALSDFKRLFDTDELLDDMLPDLVAAHPQRYAGMGVAQLAAEMHGQMRARRQTQTANAACATVPEPAMTPAEAYTRLVRGEVEQVPVADACGRIAATGIVPYPPGIPLLMPGELTGCDRGSVLGYLRALEEFDRRFPGFGHESQGVTATDSGYRIHCIRG
jgi:arginine decarboxylase